MHLGAVEGRDLRRNCALGQQAGRHFLPNLAVRAATIAELAGRVRDSADTDQLPRWPDHAGSQPVPSGGRIFPGNVETVLQAASGGQTQVSGDALMTSTLCEIVLLIWPLELTASVLHSFSGQGE